MTMMKKYAVWGVSLLAASLLVAAAALPAVAREEGMKDKGENSREKAHQMGSTLEVHLFDSGKVLVRGAKVTAVSGATLTATTSWGSTSMTWTVQTDGDTNFIRRYDGKSSISEVSVGDLVSFKGKLVETASSLTVNADIVKDWSNQKKPASFSGTVQSIDSALKSFVLGTEKKGNVTVVTNASTSIKKGDSVGVFADILLNARVSVKGVWDAATSKLTAEVVKIKL